MFIMVEGKKTPFYEKHVALGAKIVDYSGWLMPVQYDKGLVEEVLATRKKVTLFDVSHMGVIAVTGAGAEAYLQKVATNDMSKLKDDAALYSPICYPDGGVVDDILIYRLNKESYLLVVNASNADKDFAWFKEHLKEDDGASVDNVSSDYCLLALQGPLSEKVLQPLVSVDLKEIKNYRFKDNVTLNGVKCIVSRTGYTGEDGFEVYGPADAAEKIWDAIWQEGEKHGISAAGLGARDVLRLEASMPLYGHEMSDKIDPLMAGLGRFVALNKQIPFIGQEALKEKKEKGFGRKLFALEMLERGVPRENYPVTDGEKEIGWVSSGTYSPTLEKFIAMAFLDPEAVKVGSEVKVAIRNRSYGAQIIKMPFYRRES